MTLSTALNSSGKIAIILMLTTATNPSQASYQFPLGFKINTGDTLYSTSCEKRAAVSISDKISSIIENLGLNVKDLESILGVKRASVYNWKNGEIQPQDDETIALINKTYNLAEVLSSVIEHKFGRLAKTHTYKGSGYIDKIRNGSSTEEIIEHAIVINSLISKRNNIPHSIIDGTVAPEIEDFIIG